MVLLGRDAGRLEQAAASIRATTPQAILDTIPLRTAQSRRDRAFKRAFLMVVARTSRNLLAPSEYTAGCLVTEGKVNRNATARLRRGREIVHEGKVATLKRFKDDANEVRAGLECGIKLDDFNGYQVGDVIECFEIQKVRAAL
mgnify:CR=1 FL=1